MIRIRQQFEALEIEIKKVIPHESIFAFLQKKGYEIKPWLYRFCDETFPGGKTNHEKWTFTATKEGEKQSEETLFLNVFEKEIKNFLNEIS